jgi:hypothetical protein
LFEHDLFGKPVSTFPDHAAADATIELSEAEKSSTPGAEFFRLGATP